MADDAIRTGSGRTWDEWFRILDDWGGTQRTHRDIARWLHDEQGVPGWWSQTVTVGYERARGMRARHETTSGFQVSVQKTIAASGDRIERAFTQTRQRNRWLDVGTLTARKTKPGRSVADFDAVDGSRVTIYLVPKSKDSTAVQVVQTKMASAANVATQRAFWRARLQALAGLLG